MSLNFQEMVAKRDRALLERLFHNHLPIKILRVIGAPRDLLVYQGSQWL
jgi:hypothetical protein